MLELWHKLRQHGFAWFLARILQKSIHNEFKAITKILYRLILYPLNKLWIYRARQHASNDTLYLFYDLAVSPITFDFCWALIAAEQQRILLGLEKLYVVLVPGPKQGLRIESPDYAAVVDDVARYWRKHEILYPLCRLMSTCVGVMVCATRDEAYLLCERVRPHVFPSHYSVTFPTVHRPRTVLCNTNPAVMALRATSQASRYIDQWLQARLQSRKLISITLRESPYMQARNSNLAEWINFAKRLNSQDYFVVFVPDTDSALNYSSAALAAFTFFNEACWNLNLRAALYEKSYLNLGVNNGTMSLCWLNARCRYITFKMCVEEVPQATTVALQQHGFVINQSLPFATALQKWVWEDDTAAVIWREFHLMCQQIESMEWSHAKASAIAV